MKKEKLFSLSEKDFVFIPTKGRGSGGQSKNKTLSACICKHVSSNSESYAEESKSYLDNKRTAFKKITETASFKAWLRMKIDAGMGRIEMTETLEDGREIKRKVNHNEIK